MLPVASELSSAPTDLRPSAPPRLWNRLAFRLAAFFAVIALVGVGSVGLFVYERQKRDIEMTLGVQLLHIARLGALQIDPALHAEVQRTLDRESEAYRRIRETLATVQEAVRLPTPVYTLTDFDSALRMARFMVASGGPARPGEPYALTPEIIDPIARTFEDGVARFTRIYHNQHGTWISAFAPVADGEGQTIAVLDVDYPVEVYLQRLDELRAAVLQAAVAVALATLLLGVLFARRFTGPIADLTRSVARVAGGDLSQALPVHSRDEIGVLTSAFNDMLEGLRQRDLIRNTLGRYVSPEVARALLESPEGLRLGGRKRVVTILMSDLRGYTQFAERGEPEAVMAVLNEYLGRIADIVIEHGGTINEFIGDAVFAVFGAPLDHPDHAERAAGCALAMQGAMAAINAAHAAAGLPRFEMGVGLHTGEAVVGNIGSEQRAKYAVVGNAVNLAARIESVTVGGQVLLSAATLEAIGELADVGEPLTVEVKGISEPLVLYELRGLGGRFAGRLPDAAGSDAQVEVALPLVCQVIEGKAVRPDEIRGVVVRLGRRELLARVDRPLAPLTTLRIRLTYPGLGYGSGDLYGRVMRGDGGDVEGLVCISLTSLDAADQRALELYLEH
jgi:class 3 adenylate cyclase